MLKQNVVILKTVQKKDILGNKNQQSLLNTSDAKSILRRSKISGNEITAQILHRPNKRVIFNKFPIYLWMYNLGTKRKHPELSDSSRFRRKLRYAFGEAPVLLDSNLVKLSADNIHNYLFNAGFFDAKINTHIKKKGRKAVVSYTVIPGRAYLINSVFVRTADSGLYSIVKKFTDESDYFRLWWPMNTDKLNDSRNYLSRKMRDLGYYTITPESYHFEADTFQTLKHVAVTLILDNPLAGKHEKYHFGKVLMNIDAGNVYLQRTNNPVSNHLPGMDIQLNGYPIDPGLIRRLVNIDSGNLYNQSDIERTYQALQQTNLFSVVDIRFYADTLHRIIGTRIDLKAIKRISFSLEPQGLYSPQGTSGTNVSNQTQQGSFGIAGILAFNNRNVAKNAENLRISSVLSYEAIIKKDAQGNSLGRSWQQGVNASLTLPHFRLFKNSKLGSNISQRNTLLSLTYQYENNPNFYRSAIPASITFQYVKPKVSWYYTPTEISFNRNILAPAFADKLSSADSAFIYRVFTNQFVTAAKLGFIYANNHNKPGQTYIFARAGVEASGNLHRLIRRITEPNFDPNKQYNLFGLQYFQYSKFEGELRIKRAIDELNGVAFRTRLGIAIPYGNSSAVPYDKRYFIGGSNSLRAWKPRSLGPGGSPKSDKNIIDRSGEFLFEANIEYRFIVFRKFLEMAIFMDAGNIWNLQHANQTAADATLLTKEKFFDQMALNTGLGFRFDFRIFLFRVDWGIPMHDPGQTLGNRWMLNKQNLTDPWGFAKDKTAIAIGIGYPF